MVNIDAIRRLLAAADAQRDPYAVAEVAAALLAANPDDSVALAHYLRALAALKLFAAAQRAMGNAGSAGVPGTVPWTSRARRFAANLRALESRDPPAAALVQAAAAELPACELHQSGDGNFQVLDTRRPVSAAWLGGLADHKAGQNLWHFDPVKTPVPTPIAFDGLGFGWLFLHILQTTEKSYLDYSCALYILAGDPLALAMLFHMHDLQAAIAMPRTRWFVRESGEAALGDFRLALARHESWTLPEQFVRCALRPLPPIPLEPAVKELAAGRGRQREERSAQITAHYQGRDTAWWARRFDDALQGRGEKLRILGITSRYTTVLQHSLAEMKSAVEATSADTCAMRIAVEPDDQSLENPFLELIAEFKPDLIFQISRLRHENPRIPREIPFLCWDQDNLPCMRTPEAAASLDDFTYVAGHGAVCGFTSLKWRRENCIFCHAAGATFRYHNGPVAPALLEKHACDFSYVSNASGTPETIAEQIRGRWKAHPGWLVVFRDAAAIVLAQSDAGRSWEHVGVRNLVREAARRRGLTLEDRPWREMTAELGTYADRCFRHTALGWVSRWCRANHKTLRLYGRGWETHADFAPWAAGVAEPGDEARAIYQATRINLQLIEPGFIHSRALDGLAAGGFFLTRSTPADGLDSPAVGNLYDLARWTIAHHIESDAQLEAAADPQVQSMIETARAYFRSHQVHDPMWRSLQVWAQAPAAAMLFPQLPAITFRDERSFGELASRYLADDARRASVAHDMRRVVCRHFSYNARWNTFLDAVRHGLEVAAGEPAAAGV